MTRWDAEFSLALHNRTGKYFIGRDLLHLAADLFDRTWYWRVHQPSPPIGLPARLLGRALKMNQDPRALHVLPAAAAFRPCARLLHLDPFTVLHCRLQPTDAVLCHDLGPITHPELFTPAVTSLYHRAYGAIAERRPRMIFVSEASRDAFTTLYGAWGRFPIIYPPLRQDVTAAEQTPPPDIDSPFLLTVGSIGMRKNQYASITAFAMSGLADRGFSYVLCGGREPGFETVAALAARTPGVRLLSYVSDGELSWLYAHARGFVLASRLEGFGVPLAEAIAYGLIPLVTVDSVLQEVAGSAALTAPSDDPSAIAVAMRDLAMMPEDEAERRRAALGMSIARFSIDRFAADWRTFLTEDAAGILQDKARIAET